MDNLTNAFANATASNTTNSTVTSLLQQISAQYKQIDVLKEKWRSLNAQGQKISASTDING